MEVRHPINQNDPFFLRHAPFIAVVDEVLSAGECETLIERIESLSPSFAPITTARGFVDRPDIRNNDRVIFDDVALAADLFERLRQLLPERLRPDDDPRTAVGLNPRFRGYRYSPGQRFAPHYDGHYQNDAECSELTVLFYLNEGFVGGATSFCDWEVKVEPRRGQALLFSHRVLHEGCILESGRKYVLRSDAMYQRQR